MKSSHPYLAGILSGFNTPTPHTYILRSPWIPIDLSVTSGSMGLEEFLDTFGRKKVGIRRLVEKSHSWMGKTKSAIAVISDAVL